MKTTVEIEGYQIVVTGDEDRISVTAMLDEEVVEEFTIEIEEGGDEVQGEEGEDLKAFGDDEEAQDFPEGDDAPEEDEFDGQLESFSKFVEKRKS
jgi:hypothetical protein